MPVISAKGVPTRKIPLKTEENALFAGFAAPDGTLCRVILSHLRQSDPPQVPASPFRKKTEFFILISGNSCYIHWYGPFTGNKRLREGESENG